MTRRSVNIPATLARPWSSRVHDATAGSKRALQHPPAPIGNVSGADVARQLCAGAANTRSDPPAPGRGTAAGVAGAEYPRVQAEVDSRRAAAPGVAREVSDRRHP